MGSPHFTPTPPPRLFYQVDIVLLDASSDQVLGRDCVELSQGAHRLVCSGDYPTVAGLRLPPRFPSSAQLADFRGYVLRNGRSLAKS